MNIRENILAKTCDTTSAFVNSRSKAERKLFGQFFTSIKTAEFMASLYDVDFNKSSIKILDAGAGTGILSTAIVQRLRNENYYGQIYLVCYENDIRVLPILAENLEHIKKSANINYEIKIGRAHV